MAIQLDLILHESRNRVEFPQDDICVILAIRTEGHRGILDAAGFDGAFLVSDGNHPITAFRPGKMVLYDGIQSNRSLWQERFLHAGNQLLNGYFRHLSIPPRTHIYESRFTYQ